MRQTINQAKTKAKPAIALLACFVVVVFAQDIDPEIPSSLFPPTITIEREDKIITAIKYGPDDKGAAIVCIPKDGDTEKITSTVYADELPYRVHITIDKNTIRAPIAVVQKQEKGDGHLEAFDGTVVPSPEDSSDCMPSITPKITPGSVIVTQGKTRLTGSKVVYDESNGLAIVSGPIEFKRPQENDELTGVSDNITVDVDNEKTFLEGNVTLSSHCRKSTADKVEYDDIKNVAYLEGKPAISKQLDASGNVVGELKGERIEYFLETNDVIVVVGDSVTGSVGKFDESASACK